MLVLFHWVRSSTNTFWRLILVILRKLFCCVLSFSCESLPVRVSILSIVFVFGFIFRRLVHTFKNINKFSCRRCNSACDLKWIECFSITCNRNIIDFSYKVQCNFIYFFDYFRLLLTWTYCDAQYVLNEKYSYSVVFI